MPDKKKGLQKEKTADITFFHKDLLELPEGGSPPYLKGYKCNNCQQLDFPKLDRCPNCWGEDFTVIPLSKRGVLYSFTTIYMGQPAIQMPYNICYVDLPEGLRIFSQLEGDPDAYECGDTVELTTGPIRQNKDGKPVVSYKFCNAEGLGALEGVGE